MDLLSVALIVLGLLLLGYLTYGKLAAKIFKLNNAHPTPALSMPDGTDFVPAKKGLLLGQHFSAIAAAGPIVGPILAGVFFGWFPTLVWIVIGSIFIGGVHDLAALIASVRHKGESIGVLVKEYMSPLSYKLFLCFIWLTLVYLIIAFADITAQTFTTVFEGVSFGNIVAASSVLYLLLGLLMGVFLYKLKMPLWLATLVFLPLVLLVVLGGQKLPSQVLSVFSGIGVKEWDILLLCYCFFASIIPVWLLLQPRGYLGGCFLYGTILASIIGIIFGGFKIEFPALQLEGFRSSLNSAPLFPVLFITVACGAISGFHSIVASGTTSKQLEKESDAKAIGYGAMLLEAVVAFFALSTVMMLSKSSELAKSDPNMIFASGIANFLKLTGIDKNVAFGFALLAFSTFIYDSLDVTTRLGRYVFQELTGAKGGLGKTIATVATLAAPAVFLLSTRPEEKAYMVAWPLFGSSNQLLASLALMAVSIWQIKNNRNIWITVIPMFFMLVVTVWSLFIHIWPKFYGMIYGAPLGINGWIIFSTSVLLLALTGLLIFESSKTIFYKK